MWLEDGTALQDRLGPGYTLLRVGAARESTAALQDAFQRLGAPLEVLEITEKRVREIYESDLVLVRPDLHVAWRGHTLPVDVAKLAMIATGCFEMPK